MRRIRSALPKPHCLAIVSTGQDAFFEFAAGRIGPRPFGELRRRVPGLTTKKTGEIARAHAHAIRQGLIR